MVYKVHTQIHAQIRAFMFVDLLMISEPPRGAFLNRGFIPPCLPSRLPFLLHLSSAGLKLRAAFLILAGPPEGHGGVLGVQIGIFIARLS